MGADVSLQRDLLSVGYVRDAHSKATGSGRQRKGMRVGVGNAQSSNQGRMCETGSKPGNHITTLRAERYPADGKSVWSGSAPVLTKEPQ